jgi:hypothetical protein
MFGFLTRKPKVEPDYVLLRMHDNCHNHKPVKWFSGRPYAAPYSAETMCELKPNGSLIGPSYVSEWLPASPKMQEFFDSQPKAA